MVLIFKENICIGLCSLKMSTMGMLSLFPWFVSDVQKLGEGLHQYGELLSS